jgi:hypothetical protein
MNLGKLKELKIDECSVLGTAYTQQLISLAAAAAVDPPNDGAAAAQEASKIFFSAFGTWRAGKEASEEAVEAVPPLDAVDEERGWFRALFKVLIDGPASLDREWLLLLSVDNNLLAAAQVLLSDDFGAKGTEPVEDDPQKRVVAEQSSSNSKLQALVSTLGAFMGRFRIIKDVHKSATSNAFSGCDTSPSAVVTDIVLKFMKDKSQYDREVAARVAISGVGGQKKREDEDEDDISKQYLVGILETSDDIDAEAFAHAAQEHNPPLYPHCIIMEAGERNLQTIYLHERPDEHAIRSMMTQVFQAAAYLHSRGIAHCDVKALNILRMESDRKLRLAQNSRRACYHQRCSTS